MGLRINGLVSYSLPLPPHYFLDHILLHLCCKFRIDGQGDGVYRGVFAVGEIAGFVAEVLEAFLFVKGNGIVDFGAYVVFCEGLS